MYLKPNTTETGTIDYNAINANSKMVNNYMLIMQGDSVLDKVTKTLKLEDKGRILLKIPFQLQMKQRVRLLKLLQEQMIHSYQRILLVQQSISFLQM